MELQCDKAVDDSDERQVTDKFPRLLVEHNKRVLNVPEIMEWVKKRPVTEF